MTLQGGLALSAALRGANGEGYLAVGITVQMMEGACGEAIAARHGALLTCLAQRPQGSIFGPSGCQQ